MSSKNGCAAPRCTVEQGVRVCPVMVPNWGGQGCRERRRDEFDPSSLYWKATGKSMILIGCLKGQYDQEAHKCRKGTRGVLTVNPV